MYFQRKIILDGLIITVFLFVFANLDQALESNTYIIVPLYDRDAEPSKKTYSPNRKYYYQYILQDNLGIYDAAIEQLLVEFKLPSEQGTFLQIGGHLPNKTEGWMADNSGVYFRIRYTGGFFGSPHQLSPFKSCVYQGLLIVHQQIERQLTEERGD